MHYVIGWSLLSGFVLLVWLLIRLSGPAGDAKATCGLGGCGKCASSAPPTSPGKHRT